MNNIYINIKDVAEAKGLKSTRSLRLELNKNESKYISREVQVNGGTSYEILFSSLEPELQDKLRKNENKTTALVPLNYQPPQFVSDQAKITANFRLNIVINGLVYRYDDPFWQSFYPPNGWRCRCRVNALSDYNLQKKNRTVSSSAGTLSEELALVSKKSGEYKPVTVYTDPLTGKRVAPDVGWSHNPASGLIEGN